MQNKINQSEQDMELKTYDEIMDFFGIDKTEPYLPDSMLNVPEEEEDDREQSKPVDTKTTPPEATDPQ